MKIRTIVDRPGKPQGSVIDIPNDQAADQVQRGLAVPVHTYTRTEEVTRDGADPAAADAAP